MLDFAAFPPLAKVGSEASWWGYRLQDGVSQTREELRSARHNCEDTNGKQLRLSSSKSWVLLCPLRLR